MMCLRREYILTCSLQATKEFPKLTINRQRNFILIFIQVSKCTTVTIKSVLLQIKHINTSGYKIQHSFIRWIIRWPERTLDFRTSPQLVSPYKRLSNTVHESSAMSCRTTHTLHSPFWVKRKGSRRWCQIQHRVESFLKAAALCWAHQIKNKKTSYDFLYFALEIYLSCCLGRLTQMWLNVIHADRYNTSSNCWWWPACIVFVLIRFVAKLFHQFQTNILFY